MVASNGDRISNGKLSEMKKTSLTHGACVRGDGGEVGWGGFRLHLGHTSGKHFYIENILCANQFFRENRTNFNLGHQIDIQGGAQREWEGDL